MKLEKKNLNLKGPTERGSNRNNHPVRTGIDIDFSNRRVKCDEILLNFRLRHSFFCLSFAEPGSAPRNIQVRLLSSSTMVIQWEEPETPNGQVIVSARQTSTTSTRPAKRSTVRRPVLRSSMCDVLETTKSANRSPQIVQTFKSAKKKIPLPANSHFDKSSFILYYLIFLY